MCERHIPLLLPQQTDCIVCVRVCVADQTKKKKIFLFVTEMWRTGSKRCIVETLGWILKRHQREKKEGIKAGCMKG